MRFIPTKFHAPLDYIVGAVLIAGPWIFQYSDSGAATAISIVLGVGLIAYSLFTNYELGLWKVAPSSAKPNSHGDAASSAPATMSMTLCTAIGATFQRPSS